MNDFPADAGPGVAVPWKEAGFLGATLGVAALGVGLMVAFVNLGEPEPPRADPPPQRREHRRALPMPEQRPIAEDVIDPLPVPSSPRAGSSPGTAPAGRGGDRS